MIPTSLVPSFNTKVSGHFRLRYTVPRWSLRRRFVPPLPFLYGVEERGYREDRREPRRRTQFGLTFSLLLPQGVASRTVSFHLLPTVLYLTDRYTETTSLSLISINFSTFIKGVSLENRVTTDDDVGKKEGNPRYLFQRWREVLTPGGLPDN